MEDTNFKIENGQEMNIVKNPRSNPDSIFFKKKKKLLLILYSLA